MVPVLFLTARDAATARTELGRLSAALNGMLDRIEASDAERAAAADRMRRFIADTSYELRTPIFGINGFTELYRIGGMPERGRVVRPYRSRAGGRCPRPGRAGEGGWGDGDSDGGGTGLGLAIVRTAPGEGAVFRLLLPRSAGAGEDEGDGPARPR
ncbi:hypothetical protein [Streptomyces boninensis]|uniref:hypothetical protein n=1 Tax=Streptomyces boninensis TaxID=2039455 RepID=UPI003B214E28